MKQVNSLVEFLKLFGLLIISWILWIFIFTVTITPEGEGTVEPFQGASIVFGILTAIILLFGVRYNQTIKLYQIVKGEFGNIQIMIDRGNRLLDKANMVVENYMSHEYKTFVKVAEERTGHIKGKKQIKNSLELQSQIESYPELKANENIMKLLEQIQQCETAIATFKIDYNQKVSEYNAMIHSFPVLFFRKIVRLKEAEFYQEKTEEITDTLLKI